MAYVQLLGSTSDWIDGSAVSNYFWGNRWQAALSGTLKQIRCFTTGNVNVKVAIYADNAGEPSTRLAYTSGNALTTGENFINMSDVSIVAGNYYWLAENNDGSKFGGQAGGASRIKAATYSTYTFPNPAGSGYSVYICELCISGWGELPSNSNPRCQVIIM